MICQPNIFARLDLEIQKNFSNKHALALWEYLSEHLCSNKIKNALLEPISLEQLKHFLGIQDSKAYSSFFLLNAKALQPAIAEINQYSDLLVTYQYIKQKKKVIAIVLEFIYFFLEKVISFSYFNKSMLINALIQYQ